jgi:hypothetical protein
MQQFILTACCHTVLCDLPTALNGPFSCGCLLGLAPGGVCRAACFAAERGELLPRLFTLAGAPVPAVCFLWHFPSPHGARVLPGALPYGVRTFLTASNIYRWRCCLAPSDYMLYKIEYSGKKIFFDAGGILCGQNKKAGIEK